MTAAILIAALAHSAPPAPLRRGGRGCAGRPSSRGGKLLTLSCTQAVNRAMNPDG